MILILILILLLIIFLILLFILLLLSPMLPDCERRYIYQFKPQHNAPPVPTTGGHLSPSPT
jgi:hypothetical protein